MPTRSLPTKSSLYILAPALLVLGVAAGAFLFNKIHPRPISIHDWRGPWSTVTAPHDAQAPDTNRWVNSLSVSPSHTPAVSSTTTRSSPQTFSAPSHFNITVLISEPPIREVPQRVLAGLDAPTQDQRSYDDQAAARRLSLQQIQRAFPALNKNFKKIGVYHDPLKTHADIHYALRGSQGIWRIDPESLRWTLALESSPSIEIASELRSRGLLCTWERTRLHELQHHRMHRETLEQKRNGWEIAMTLYAEGMLEARFSSPEEAKEKVNSTNRALMAQVLEESGKINAIKDGSIDSEEAYLRDAKNCPHDDIHF